MTENEARYIVRMIGAFQQNCLFLDTTDEDEKLFCKMKETYQTAGRWDRGKEAALIEMIMYVSQNGVPGGKYLQDIERIAMYQKQRETPLIEREK